MHRGVSDAVEHGAKKVAPGMREVETEDDALGGGDVDGAPLARQIRQDEQPLGDLPESSLGNRPLRRLGRKGRVQARRSKTRKVLY
jgi:hypothetical protein